MTILSFFGFSRSKAESTDEEPFKYDFQERGNIVEWMSPVFTAATAGGSGVGRTSAGTEINFSPEDQDWEVSPPTEVEFKWTGSDYWQDSEGEPCSRNPYLFGGPRDLNAATATTRILADLSSMRIEASTLAARIQAAVTELQSFCEAEEAKDSPNGLSIYCTIIASSTQTKGEQLLAEVGGTQKRTYNELRSWIPRAQAWMKTLKRKQEHIRDILGPSSFSGGATHPG